MSSLYIGLIGGITALAFGLLFTMNLVKKGQGNETMQSIAKAIQEGSAAFLKREYTYLALFVLAVFVILWIFIDQDGLPIEPSLPQLWHT